MLSECCILFCCTLRGGSPVVNFAGFFFRSVFIAVDVTFGFFPLRMSYVPSHNELIVDHLYNAGFQHGVRTIYSHL